LSNPLKTHRLLISGVLLRIDSIHKLINTNHKRPVYGFPKDIFMHITQAKTKLATYIHDHVEKLLGVKDDIRTHDIIEFLEVIAGIYVESCFLFEKPDIAMSEGFEKLSASLGVAPTDAVIPYQSISHPQKLDARTEQGRALARSVLEEFGECEFSFCEFILWMVSNYLVDWEGNNIPRSDGFRLFMDAATRCMAFEISAQELCDIVIEKRIGTSDWSLADAVCGLSAYAGYKYGMTQANHGKEFYQDSHIDMIVYVMTQEAVRMGVPAGSNWRLGLVANDSPADPPTELIESITPLCRDFFSALNLMNGAEQSVACAKAAGRMLAVVACGDTAELPHAIAKPLAMAALMESYRALMALHPGLISSEASTHVDF